MAPFLAQELKSSFPCRETGISQDVEGNPLPDPSNCPNSIDRPLHFPKSTVGSFHRVGGRGQEFLVKEQQGLFQIRREKLLESFSKGFEPSNSLLELLELGNRCSHSAAAIEKPVDLVGNISQYKEGRQPTRDCPQSLAICGCQLPGDEQMPVLKDVPDFFLEAFPLPGYSLRRGPARAATSHFRYSLFETPPNACDSLEDCLVDFHDDMENADLMRDRAEYLQDRLRIQGGPVRGYPQQHAAAGIQVGFAAGEEADDVLMGRVVVKHFEEQTPVSAVINKRQLADVSVIDFVYGDVAGEVGECLVEILPPHRDLRFFFPKPRPSSEWFPREQRRSGLATCARMRDHREDHLRQRSEWPSQQPVWYSAVYQESSGGMGRGNSIDRFYSDVGSKRKGRREEFPWRYPRCRGVTA